MKKVEILYERDGSTWIAHVAGEERAHTYGRSLAAARRNMAEVVALWFDLEPGGYEPVEQFPFSPEAQEALDALATARDRHARAVQALHEATRRAIELLARREGLSLRDTAELVDLSFQRVHQLVS